MVMAVGTANIHSISDRSSDSSRLVLVLCEGGNMNGLCTATSGGFGRRGKTVLLFV